MIGTQTPFRMSFIGGGSDMKDFYAKSPGCVISTTINKYMYIFLHKYFDDRIQIKYSKTELVNNIANIKHPIVREVLTKFSLKGIDINSIADIPSGTGLGSSSSYTVGLFHALYNYIGENTSKEQLAKDACELEIDILKEPIGKQDQYAAAYGGLNLIRFLNNEDVIVEPIKMATKAYKQLEKNLLLFFTGTTRNASDVLTDQKNNLLSEKSKFDTLVHMTNLVEKAKIALIGSNLDNFGKILDKNWQLKKSLSKKISNNHIESLYSLAKNNGALGGKILGAGGGGFVLFYCEKNKQEKLRNALKKLKEVNFMFEKLGTRRIEFTS